MCMYLVCMHVYTFAYAKHMDNYFMYVEPHSHLHPSTHTHTHTHIWPIYTACMYDMQASPVCMVCMKCVYMIFVYDMYVCMYACMICPYICMSV